MKGLILIIIIFSLALLNGCASISYETKDGTKVSYSRFLTSMDSIEAKVGDASVKANKIQVDAATLQALLGMVGGAK